MLQAACPGIWWELRYYHKVLEDMIQCVTDLRLRVEDIHPQRAIFFWRQTSEKHSSTRRGWRTNWFPKGGTHKEEMQPVGTPETTANSTGPAGGLEFSTCVCGTNPRFGVEEQHFFVSSWSWNKVRNRKSPSAWVNRSGKKKGVPGKRNVLL